MNDKTTSTPPAATAGPDLILHPVRMRIITTLSIGAMTATEVAEHLRDVPPATLYRHLNVLRRGGVIVVAGERRVRGATERRFVLNTSATSISPDDLARATPSDHMRWFAGFAASLMGVFARYLDQGTPDLVRDGIGYREVVLNLTDAEFVALATALNAAVGPYLANQPAEGRRARILATIVLPAS